MIVDAYDLKTNEHKEVKSEMFTHQELSVSSTEEKVEINKILGVIVVRNENESDTDTNNKFVILTCKNKEKIYLNLRKISDLNNSLILLGCAYDSSFSIYASEYKSSTEKHMIYIGIANANRETQINYLLEHLDGNIINVTDQEHSEDDQAIHRKIKDEFECNLRI